MGTGKGRREGGRDRKRLDRRRKCMAGWKNKEKSVGVKEERGDRKKGNGGVNSGVRSKRRERKQRGEE